MKKNAKKLLCLILALVLSLALAVPALALGTTQTGTTTLTMEVPDISYVLNVPANCAIPFEGETNVRDLGTVSITDCVRFAPTNYVIVRITKTDFTGPSSLKYDIKSSEVTAKHNITGVYFYPADASREITVKDETSYTPNAESYSVVSCKDSLRTQIALRDMSKLPAGTYTSTITFTADLY